MQRGGTSTPFDRVLAIWFGLAAVDAEHPGASGVMAALRGTDIVQVPLAEAIAQLTLVPLEKYAEAEVFFGWWRNGPPRGGPRSPACLAGLARASGRRHRCSGVSLGTGAPAVGWTCEPP